MRLVGSKQKAPLFSVLLPSKNRLDLLKQAIDSVLKQRFSSFEIIVSDNCSDDDYAQYIQFLGDSRVRLVRTAVSVPVTDNWNNALAHASGQYVIMLGDDDALAPDSLSELNRRIIDYDRPDVIYAMAYHYVYPNVVPDAPGGYLATVTAGPIFSDRKQPSFLDVAQARFFGRQALKFRHLFGFNSQFFIWSRQFIESLAKYGPFFQSPYPDFYSSIVTMLKATRILVDPAPKAMIGISPKSFGFYFHQDQLQAGNDLLGLRESDAHPVRSLLPGAADALDLPGSAHYRNWLLAALYVLRRFENEPGLTVDLRRYRNMQIFEAAYQFSCNRQPEHRLTAPLRERLSPKEERLFDRFSWSFALMKRSKHLNLPHIHDAVFGLFHIYPDLSIINHDLGPHRSISDAWRWLNQQSELKRDCSAPLSPPVARRLLGRRLKQLKSPQWYRNQWRKVRGPGWTTRGRQLLKRAILSVAPPIRRLYENSARATWMANHLGHRSPRFVPPQLTGRQQRVVAEFQDLLYSLADAHGNRSYCITWLGYETMKWPSDMWLYQEIISQMKPDVIVETGTFLGGSALFLACMCDMVGHGQVLTIDRDSQIAGERPRHPRINYLSGSSVDPEIVNQVAQIIDGRSKVMVILDSDHTREHVLEELKAYSRFVTTEGILVVEDTHINGHPTYKDFGPGPWEAIDDFLAQNHEFHVDRDFERFLVTANPNGFLRRKRVSAAA